MISLEGALRTCKVDVAWANRVESDRFFNPNNMVCPVWNGVDNAGRNVSPDSFTTKTAGCNSAEDRVLVENNQRPQYMEYVNLSAQGFGSDIYSNTMPWENVGASNTNRLNTQSCPGYGNYGIQMSAKTLAPCSNQYSQAMAQEQYEKRKNAAMQEYFYANRAKTRSGF